MTEPAPLTVDARGVAMLLGLEFEQAFNNRRPRLQKHGFPRPLPGIVPLRWSIHAVEAWVRDARAGGAPFPHAVPTTATRRHPYLVALENRRTA